MSDDIKVALVIVGIGGVLLVLWVLTRIQGICLDYWQQVGGNAPPCWLPFGGA